MAKKTLGKYEIIDRLGRGGMAEVYRAYHASLDRYVAIKLLHPFLADDNEFKERFEREAQNIARLRHPHIVQVFDFDYDEVGESYYMVMELIEGQTLKDVLFDLASTGQQISLERAIQITKEAALALSYAHKRNMIHRDVKPANLMVDSSDGRVVLTDFGIAKIVTGAQFTASGGMIGTPAYMSPEQGMGESGDERSDLYSLGVILYQMLTGQLPYDADTPLAVILKHLNEPLPSARDVNPEIPLWLEDIVQRVLAKEPNERFGSADEFIAVLEAGEDGDSVVVPTKKATGEMAAIKEDTPIRSALITQKFATGTAQLISSETTGTTQPIIIAEPRNNWILYGLSAIVTLGVLLMLGIVLGQGGRGPLAGAFATEVGEVITQIPSATFTNTLTATYTDTPSPTSTFTETPSPTSTYTDTPSPTATFTDTPSPTSTYTETPSPTATYTFTPTDTFTPTLTPSETPSPTLDSTATQEAILQQTSTSGTATAQAQADFFATQRAITPTLNIQRVLEGCDLEYAIVSPENLDDPPNANSTRNPRLVQSGSEFELKLVLQNSSTCDWPEGLIFLSFVEQSEADLRGLTAGCNENRIFTDHNLTDPDVANIRLTSTVLQGEQIEITMKGRAGTRFGCYFGVWELRIPDYGLFIGEPFIIAYRAFGGN